MKKRILICDDAAFMRKMLKGILEEGNYEVVGEAVNGTDAVSMTRELHPDLVLMDITMPEMNGIDAVKEIKKENQDTKMVMCSALGQGSMILESLKAGASDFIVKPFEADRVIEALEKVFA